MTAWLTRLASLSTVDSMMPLNIARFVLLLNVYKNRKKLLCKPRYKKAHEDTEDSVHIQKNKNTKTWWCKASSFNGDFWYLWGADTAAGRIRKSWMTHQCLKPQREELDRERDRRQENGKEMSVSGLWGCLEKLQMLGKRRKRLMTITPKPTGLEKCNMMSVWPLAYLWWF